MEEGLRLAKGEHFDLYLFNHKLPDGTGIALCQQIRTFERHTPVIYCVDFPDRDNHLEAMKAGAQVCWTKPIEPGLLQ